MKNTIIDLKASFALGHDIFEQSINKAQVVTDMYHNKQYTEYQLSKLRARGAPAETFNVIKLFARTMLGYYSTIVNTIKAEAVNPADVTVVSILNDVTDYITRFNQLETIGDDIKLDLLLSGICCAEVDVEDSGERDQFGRPVYDIILNHIPANSIVTDHMSVKQDYSDARFLHVYKWISEEVLQNLIKNTKLELSDFDPERNFLNVVEADFDRSNPGSNSRGFTGAYKKFNHYLLVDSVLVDDDNKRWRTLWIDETIVQTEEITFSEVKFPYRIQKLYKTTDMEYSGVFEEVVESQNAINQALIKLQQAVNTQKVFVQEGSIENLEIFRNQFNRVNAIIEVLDIGGINVENLSREAVEQYQVIDKSFDRIKLILGINDSFLGMAFASDSGRKVKLQQNATAMSLRYITVRIEQFYRLLGWDIVNLVKQYFYANRIMNITDPITGTRWVEINKPLKVFVGVDNNGQPIEQLVFEEVIDLNTNKPMEDEDGNIIMAPVSTSDTDLSFTKVNVSLDSVSFNDEDEKVQLLMEQALSGPMGQSLMQLSPPHYLKAIALVLKTTKMRFSPELSRIYEEAAGLAQQGQLQQGQPPGVQGQGSLGFDNNAKSQALKLPQNTNEGVQ